MIGPIIGDIAGSRFEFNNWRSKEFDLFTTKCFFTDDTVMSLAICQALLEWREPGAFVDLEARVVQTMQEFGVLYPNSGYGGRFRVWLRTENPKPYGSFGNGSAMRVSGCGYVAESIEEAISLSRIVTAVTHNHPEGIKGAEATAVAVYLARTGKSMREIREYIEDRYYKIDFTLDEIRPTYEFNETCQETVPQAFAAFFESTSFEDCVRNSISVGGDSDTLAAIACGVAEAYYGVPDDLRRSAVGYLDERLRGILMAFESQYPAKRV